MDSKLPEYSKKPQPQVAFTSKGTVLRLFRIEARSAKTHRALPVARSVTNRGSDDLNGQIEHREISLKILPVRQMTSAYKNKDILAGSNWKSVSMYLYAAQRKKIRENYRNLNRERKILNAAHKHSKSTNIETL